MAGNAEEYRLIASEELTEADVPEKMAGWMGIAKFAMTFDEFDSFEECFDAADRVEQAYERDPQFAGCSLWDLRAFLLMEERGCQHRGDWPSPERMQLIYDAIEAIRDKVRLS
ncbi:hypothetical protein [Paenibacillus sp. 32352]|uniref:hypothetical protein n=1 Tax=Paenibacillus sp. 32352 TaxID=1969111 RepID=UPI0009AC75A4|nr:hypothetical protein [Paenibacillus sp. 32352]